MTSFWFWQSLYQGCIRFWNTPSKFYMSSRKLAVAFFTYAWKDKKSKRNSWAFPKPVLKLSFRVRNKITWDIGVLTCSAHSLCNFVQREAIGIFLEYAASQWSQAPQWWLKGSSISHATSPNKELCELCVKYNEPATVDFLKCVWCERWQHSRCVNIYSTEKVFQPKW